MVVLVMRDPRQRIHEGEGIVLVGETERLLDPAIVEGPARQRGDVLGEFVGAQAGRAVAAMHRRESEQPGVERLHAATAEGAPRESDSMCAIRTAAGGCES